MPPRVTAPHILPWSWLFGFDHRIPFECAKEFRAGPESKDLLSRHQQAKEYRNTLRGQREMMPAVRAGPARKGPNFQYQIYVYVSALRPVTHIRDTSIPITQGKFSQVA